ncbi:MAG: hypothetical protein RDU24_05205 [Humidesulfovibrio sp.]|uniref:hypothetical protein n=1 Tax=Humidesulfovibrio sp. TaxID=2910988 RepID=UPI0027EF7C57|nr:hypothetical protein [Humidesulfovibrio sp.]MDQ7834759.1 hypothetical protein [Humidesulfovibrio sp.]
MRSTPDICIAWLNVHGGAFHKLIHLRDVLSASGISSELLFSTSPPHGLKAGAGPGSDVPTDAIADLERRGVFLLPRQEVLRRAESSKARLLLVDAHHDPDLPGLIAKVRARGVATAQMATLLGDFTCHGAEHLLLQHPLTLFFELEFNRTAESRRFFEAASITFTGNIFFEPTLNRLHGGYATREDFFGKYGFDPKRPLCLWLPSAPDVRDESYGQVVRAVRNAGHNLAVKLHPWEYAFKKHGPPHPWGLEDSSDALWGVTAVDEADTTWAYLFCDAAILRASAMSLELPFWDKPSVTLPSANKPGLFVAQASMVRSCSTPLSGPDELPAFLGKPLPAYAPAAYAAARAQVRLDPGSDAYALTTTALAGILEGRAAGVQGSQAGLRKLYDPHVTPELKRSLRPVRRLRYSVGRLLRGLC